MTEAEMRCEAIAFAFKQVSTGGGMSGLNYSGSSYVFPDPDDVVERAKVYFKFIRKASE